MEGRTLFLRNVAVDSTEKSIFDRMRRFGPVAYVKLVRGSNSAAPHKGSAFVKFAHRTSADDALRFASSGVGQGALPSAAPGSKALTTALAADVGGIVIDGRKVVVTRCDCYGRRRSAVAAFPPHTHTPPPHSALPVATQGRGP